MFHTWQLKYIFNICFAYVFFHLPSHTEQGSRGGCRSGSRPFGFNEVAQSKARRFLALIRTISFIGNAT